MSKSILTQAASNLLKVTLSGTAGWSPNHKVSNGGAVLANEFGGDAKAFKGSENILPSPHDQEYKALVKAYNAVRTHFYESTMPFGNTTDAKGGTKASGERAITVKALADGSFLTKNATLLADLDNARTDFASTITQRVSEVQYSGVLGSRFDAGNYPDPADIHNMWRYEPLVPEPITDGSKLSGMNLPRDMVESIERNLNDQITQQVKFGQQQLVDDTVKTVSAMVDNLSKLSGWFTDQKGKRPSVYDSLVTNVQDSINKMRDYALPETNQGVRLLDLADEVEKRLNLTNINSSQFKSNHSQTVQTAEAAAEVRDLLEGWDFETDDHPEQAAQTEQTSAPMPETEAQRTTSALPDQMDELDALLAGGW